MENTLRKTKHKDTRTTAVSLCGVVSVCCLLLTLNWKSHKVRGEKRETVQSLYRLLHIPKVTEAGEHRQNGEKKRERGEIEAVCEVVFVSCNPT